MIFRSGLKNYFVNILTTKFSGFFISTISLTDTQEQFSRHKFPIRDVLDMEFVGEFCGL
jgi:hypothetical protein